MTACGYMMMTERIGLMTYVTCPTIRYHPAIVAQKAATLRILSRNRFRLGLDPESFDAATAFVSPEDAAGQLGCGPDVEEHVEKIRPFLDAGFTEIALVQIGGEHQASFFAWAEEKLLPALRSL
jgi:alkanesulfonate monooxygenase SsuD/methylene tetrahydromethanopterin reductase-like flavin-dependent oxidoreductase (luciferase family)